MSHPKASAFLVWAIGVSVLIAAGCATTDEDQNYKMLDEDPSEIHSTIDSTSGLDVDRDPIQGHQTAVIEVSVDGRSAFDTPRDIAPSDQYQDTSVVIPEQDTTERAPSSGTTSSVDENKAVVAPSTVAVTEAPVVDEKSVEQLQEVAAAEEQPESTRSQVDHTMDAVAIAEAIYPSERPVPQTPVADRPSLRGLDRSHWATIVTGPESGQTAHNPIYFRDVRLAKTRVADPDLPEIQMRVESALGGTKSRSWVRTDVAGLIVQPVKVVIDGLAAIIRQPVNPTWWRRYTPDQTQIEQNKSTE